MLGLSGVAMSPMLCIALPRRVVLGNAVSNHWQGRLRPTYREVLQLTCCSNGKHHRNNE